MASLIPYQKAGVTQSPFVYVFSQLGIPYAADLMNFVALPRLSLPLILAYTPQRGCYGH